MSTPTTTELVARFERLVFRAEDDSHIIARVQPANGDVSTTVKGSPEAGPVLRASGTYRFFGAWQEHEKHGLAFAFVSYSAVVTHDKAGVIAYLTSVAENVGQKRAETLWQRYQSLAVVTLRENPDAVAEAGIMSLESAREASESLRQEVAFESVRVELLGLLSGRGFHLTPLIRELLTRDGWGRRAPQRIREDPYALLLQSFPSVGWKRADRLYLDLGHDPTALNRQALALLYWIREHGDGSTWFAAEPLGEAVVSLIGSGAEPTAALTTARDMGLITVRRDLSGTPWVAEADNALAEETVSRKLKELIRWNPPSTIGTPSFPPFVNQWMGVIGPA